MGHEVYGGMTSFSLSSVFRQLQVQVKPFCLPHKGAVPLVVIMSVICYCIQIFLVYRSRNNSYEVFSADLFPLEMKCCLDLGWDFSFKNSGNGYLTVFYLMVLEKGSIIDYPQYQVLSSLSALNIKHNGTRHWWIYDSREPIAKRE